MSDRGTLRARLTETDDEMILWITNDGEGYDAARAAIARSGADALRAYVLSLFEIERRSEAP